MNRFKLTVSRLAGVGALFVIVVAMAGCQADWADIAGLNDRDDANNGDATVPIGQTDVAGLDVAASSRSYDDTANALSNAISGQAAETTAFDFQTGHRSNGNDTGSAGASGDTDTIGSDTGTVSPGGGLGNDTPGSGSGSDSGTVGMDTSTEFDTGNGNSTMSAPLRPARVILFDNPARVTPIIQADPRAGLDLPARMLVYQDSESSVGVAYNATDYLRARYDIGAAEDALAAMADNLETLAQDAAGNGMLRRGSVSAISRGQGIVSMRSDNDFNTTRDQLAAVIDAQADFDTATSLIDHSALAARVGLTLAPSVLFIVRDNTGETPLLNLSRTAAIDLPQKILVTENDIGEVFVYYNEPDYIATRHGVTGGSEQRNAIADTLANMVNTATTAPRP